MKHSKITHLYNQNRSLQEYYLMAGCYVTPLLGLSWS